MILGIGTDIIRTERIKELFQKRSEAFIQKIFTDAERNEASTRKNPLEYYAGRWAAKEALSKALGCGIGKDCKWQDINIQNSKTGIPKISLSGNAAQKAKSFEANNFHLSISHETEYACATVLIEK